MLNYLIDENNIDIENEDTRYIEVNLILIRTRMLRSAVHADQQALIMASGATKQHKNGVPKKYTDTAFLFEIVANGLVKRIFPRCTSGLCM